MKLYMQCFVPRFLSHEDNLKLWESRGWSAYASLCTAYRGVFFSLRIV